MCGRWLHGMTTAADTGREEECGASGYSFNIILSLFIVFGLMGVFPVEVNCFACSVELMF